LLTSKGKVYACTAFLLIPTQKPFVESLIDAVYSQFIQDIQQANFLAVRNAFLFFAECTNLEVLNIFSFLSLLNVLIKQAEKADKVVKEELTYIILTVLPFIVGHYFYIRPTFR
jgi:hypothetical protein